MSKASKTIFLSSVTTEFGELRQELAGWVQRTKRCHVRHQDDFFQGGVKTLQKLVNEIQASDVVVHLIGAQSGWCIPQEQAQQFLSSRSDFGHKYPEIVEQAAAGKLPATQWEAWLGLYFNKSVISLEVQTTEVLDELQSTHLQWLAQRDEHPRSVKHRNDVFVEVLGELDGFFSFNDSSPSLNSAQQELLLRIAEENEVNYDELPTEDKDSYDSLLTAVRQSPVNSLQAYLLNRYAQWADREGGRLNNKFVKLDLQIHRGAGSDTGFYEKQGETHRSLAGLLDAHADARGLVLVGDPGCGKTTILQHHEMHSAAAALRALNDPDNSAQLLEVCLWERLSSFASNDLPAAWLEAQRAAAHNNQLQSWLSAEPRIRIRYLLDGLNEIRAASDREYRDSLRQWSSWAADGEARSELAPIFSVRRRNLSTALTSGDLQIHQVSVQRWSDADVKQYIEHRFGADSEDAKTLWQQVDTDHRLREQCSLPLDLKHQCDVYVELGRPAQSRAELFGALCWQRLLHLHSREALDDLLHTTDIRTLDSTGQWKRRLLKLPDRGELLQSLYREAAAMHTDGVQVERDEDELAQHLDEGARRQWCEAMLKLPFLEQVSEENPSLRFIHQNWQEYFAGAALAQMQPDQWPDFSADAPEPLEEALAPLGNLDPLPGPPISHWDEAAKFAVQLAESEQRLTLLQRLQQQNLALAGRAAATITPNVQLRLETTKSTHTKLTNTAAATEADLIENLRADLLHRYRDSSVDMRIRIEAAEALGDIGDPRYECVVSADSVSYLMPRGEYWVEFPAGSYTVGSEEGQDNEKPPLQVELQAFEMSFATVTNTEYRCFIECDGYSDPRWWPGVAGDWVKGEWRDQAHIDWWQERLKAVREIIDLHASDDAQINAVMELELLRGITRAGAESWRNNGMADPQDANDWLENQFGKGDHKVEPEYWRDTRFNQSAQPAVGLSVFEAEAYCRWLSHHSGDNFGLPTEAQWEASARGTAARTWPFAAGVIDPPMDQFNHERTHLRRAVPAGCFPAGDSEEGMLDMAGNVFEWAATPWAASLSPETVNQRATPDDDVPRVVRGGSYYNAVSQCRPSYRNGISPGNRGNINGFRLCRCPIHER